MVRLGPPKVYTQPFLWYMRHFKVKMEVKISYTERIALVLVIHRIVLVRDSITQSIALQ